MAESQVKVSVICNAYNHGKYIRKCLEGLVMQKTDFVYEILVHDDASTDNTAEIIREYERQYPQLIKPVYQTENQYSKGGIYPFQYPRAKGEYIALCEGDDYWTDENKLQRQVDALDAHPEVDICAHAADIVTEDGNSIRDHIAPRATKCIIPVEAVIYGGGAFVATNSLMYRSHLKTTTYEFRNMWRIDYTLQILGSLRGGMLYLPENMSAYRWMAVGSWTMRQSASREKRQKIFERMKAALETLNQETEGKYDQVISNTILKEEFVFYYMNGPYAKVLSPKYREIRKKRGLAFTMKVWMKCIFSLVGCKK